MKELSIAEKVKRYDEAIKKFDVILNLDIVKESGTIFADDVRKIFPELKESKEINIWKAIKSVVSYNVGSNKIYGASKEDMLAWLEKQGEQEPTAWSEEDESIINDIICYIRQRLNYESEKGKKKIQKCEDWLKSLKDRYTWKPSKEQLETFEYYLDADISNKDKEVLTELYNQLKQL